MSDQRQHSDSHAHRHAPEAGSEDQSASSALDERRMSEAELAAERQTLAEQQDQALRKLEALESRAAEVEEELAALTVSGEDYHQLASACEALEGLVERGAGGLFWGPEAPEAIARAQLDEAHSRIDGFRRSVEALEDAHRFALDEVEDQREVIGALDFEIHDIQQQEESLRREWVVEREETSLPTRPIAMPWMRGFEDDQRYRKALAGSLVSALLLGLIIPLIDLPITERDEHVEVPERFAKFIREERQPSLAVREVPPEPDLEKPEPEPEVEPEPEEVDEPAEETAVAAAESKPESTREKVNSKGILAFRENFSSLSASRPAARLGAEASLSKEGASEVGLPQRAMVAAQGPESSGGINLAAISRDVGGGGAELSEGVELARVASAIDGGGPNDRPRSTGAASGRTDEEIQIVFDRYKAALYRLYNRALRKDPTLRGQIVLRLTIEPDGTVSLCRVQTSDMGAPELAEQVVDSVSAFQFGEKDVPPVTILYPIDFLPTA